MAAVAAPDSVTGNGAAAPGHHSLIYHSDAGFLAAALPFLRESIAARAPTLVIVDAAHRRGLKKALGANAAMLEWADPIDWYRTPAHTMRRAQMFSTRHADSGPVRLLGEPIWAGRTAAEHTEWARYEALLNVAFPDSPIVCAYDAHTLDATTLAVAAHTHPVTLQPTRAVPNSLYHDPALYAGICDTPPLPPPPPSSHTLAFTDGLHTVREFTTSLAAEAGLTPDCADDLALAANEAATNAIEHGGGHGTVHAWNTPDGLIFEVTSPAGRINDPFPGHLPPGPTDPRGRGLWLIRQLTDLVQVRSHDHGGVTVRMHLSYSNSVDTIRHEVSTR